jgi:hypothetical protein
LRQAPLNFAKQNGLAKMAMLLTLVSSSLTMMPMRSGVCVNAPGIIALAGAYGVSLTTDTKRIIAKPTPELREAIRSHRAELKVLTRDTDAKA